jgi:hypothetical protein
MVFLCKYTERSPDPFIRQYVEAGDATEWKHQEKAKRLYELAGVFQHYFFAPCEEAQGHLPQPLVAIGALRHDVLGAYRLVPNTNGLTRSS